MNEIYTETILDYFKNPKNFGKLEKPDIESKDSNPFCGDVIEIHIKLKGNVINQARFSGTGCAISQAAASMLTEYIEGKSLDEIQRISKENILDMLGIKLSATRLSCALLGLKTLKLGVFKFLGKQMEEE
jgi:nitrogen fixation NifU-like protein